MTPTALFKNVILCAIVAVHMAKLVPDTHEALHGIASEVPVEDITSPQIKKVLKDMRSALVNYDVDGFNGVAIAAPQIGIGLRIFLVHDSRSSCVRKEGVACRDQSPGRIAVSRFRLRRLCRRRRDHKRHRSHQTRASLRYWMKNAAKCFDPQSCRPYAEE